jgi:hypothetical protein
MAVPDIYNNDPYKEKKFRIDALLIKLTSASMWAWAVSCTMTTVLALFRADTDWMKTQIVGNIIISVLFIGGKILIDSIATNVSKGSSSVNINR